MNTLFETLFNAVVELFNGEQRRFAALRPGGVPTLLTTLSLAKAKEWRAQNGGAADRYSTAFMLWLALGAAEPQRVYVIGRGWENQTRIGDGLRILEELKESTVMGL
jgi:hypothetical protein